MMAVVSESREPMRLDDERACRADELYYRVCTENGLKVMRWQDFAAWKEYVDGDIDESQLSERARVEMRELSKSFGKYLVVDRTNEPKQLKEEEEKKERAKRANKIYRQVCNEVGLKVSFFRDLKSWIDYVEGEISDSDFYEKVRLEVQKLMLHPQQESGEHDEVGG